MTAHASLALWLAVGAAVGLVIGSVTRLLWRADLGTAARRRWILAGLAAWLAADVALGAIGAFDAHLHRLVPGIVAGIALPIVGGVWLLGHTGELSRRLSALPVRSLIAVQRYRVAGVVFLIAWAAGRMGAVFALPAGVGDIGVGLTAAFAAAHVDQGSERSRRIALAWNVAGISDLVVAVALGALTSPSPFHPVALGHPNPLISRLPFVLIPVFAVPLSILLHLLALRGLRRLGQRTV
jgi:hypothetical protein